jgi:hypothetical protein
MTVKKAYSEGYMVVDRKGTLLRHRADDTPKILDEYQNVGICEIGNALAGPSHGLVKESDGSEFRY